MDIEKPLASSIADERGAGDGSSGVLAPEIPYPRHQENDWFFEIFPEYGDA